MRDVNQNFREEKKRVRSYFTRKDVVLNPKEIFPKMNSFFYVQDIITGAGTRPPKKNNENKQFQKCTWSIVFTCLLLFFIFAAKLTYFYKT
jgi:hypothetical protein